MEQLIFLLIVAVVGFINWLANRSKDQSENQTSEPGPRPFAPRPKRLEETEQERVRRFMEALGLPEAPKTRREAPPQKVVRPALQKTAPEQQPKPVLISVAAVDPVYEQFAEPQPLSVMASPASAASKFELAVLLRDRESLRSAVILREILGPPRGLQSWK